ncbi:protein of unknown function [Kyrpidia spormannii]|uniref:Uncharacterized protein n=2 Tax=Kyrpidia spormannii TaxID=2055160 RepID=A0ACA8Z9I2_9BACL|nr:protein of unknown function [Kyrpidia spormannii]CAB3393072.1 protein of unknown function [Kyrpidia spormannii]
MVQSPVPSSEPSSAPPATRESSQEGTPDAFDTLSLHPIYHGWSSIFEVSLRPPVPGTAHPHRSDRV